MKTTIVFDSEIEDDNLRMKQMLKAEDLLSLLWDFDQWLRQESKYASGDAPKCRTKTMYEVRDKLCEMMVDENISFEELYP